MEQYGQNGGYFEIQDGHHTDHKWKHWFSKSVHQNVMKMYQFANLKYLIEII